VANQDLAKGAEYLFRWGDFLGERREWGQILMVHIVTTAYGFPTRLGGWGITPGNYFFIYECPYLCAFEIAEEAYILAKKAYIY